MPSCTCERVWCSEQYSCQGQTKFPTSGAHDVIAIASPQKNNLCTEIESKSLDEVSLPLRDLVVYFLLVEKGDAGADSGIEFHLGRLHVLVLYESLC